MGGWPSQDTWCVHLRKLQCLQYMLYIAQRSDLKHMWQQHCRLRVSEVLQDTHTQATATPQDGEQGAPKGWAGVHSGECVAHLNWITDISTDNEMNTYPESPGTTARPWGAGRKDDVIKKSPCEKKHTLLRVSPTRHYQMPRGPFQLSVPSCLWSLVPSSSERKAGNSSKGSYQP